MTERIGKTFKKVFWEIKNILVWMRGFLVADRWNSFMSWNNYENA